MVVSKYCTTVINKSINASEPANMRLDQFQYLRRLYWQSTIFYEWSELSSNVEDIPGIEKNVFWKLHISENPSQMICGL